MNKPRRTVKNNTNGFFLIQYFFNIQYSTKPLEPLRLANILTAPPFGWWHHCAINLLQKRIQISVSLPLRHKYVNIESENNLLYCAPWGAFGNHCHKHDGLQEF